MGRTMGIERPIITMCENATTKGTTLCANLIKQTKSKKGFEGKILIKIMEMLYVIVKFENTQLHREARF